MKVLVLGSTGMLGHVVSKYYEDHNYEVYRINRRTPGKLYFNPEEDIRKIESIIDEIRPEAVINCMGILNKAAELDKDKAVLINSYLPHYIDRLSNEYNFKFIHISTDCVFEGTKGNYSEDSFKDATSFYGKSKALGEIVNEKNVTLRTSIIGPDPNPNGIGLFNWFMSANGEIEGYKKVIWSGVTTIELAKQTEDAIKNDLNGLYHVVNGKVINKYDLLQLFKKYFREDIIIKPNVTIESNKSLQVTRDDHVFDIPDYEEMIKDMKEWIVDNQELYPLYLKKNN